MTYRMRATAVTKQSPAARNTMEQGTRMSSRIQTRARRVLLTVSMVCAAIGVLAPAEANTNVTISGTVVDAAGDPVANVRVSPRNPYMTTQTDSQGRFAFPIPSGTEVVLEIEPNFTTAYPNPRAASIYFLSNAFTPDDNQDLGTLTLPPMKTSTVRVVDENGVPIYSAGVSLVTGGTTWLGSEWADQGHYLTDTISIASATYNYETRTPDSGTIEVVQPRYTHGGLANLRAATYTSDGATYTTTSADATGTGTSADPFLMSIDGYTVAPPAMPAATATVTSGNRAGVSWPYPGALTHGAALTGYTVTANPGGATVEVGPNVNYVPIEGLTYGTTYTFTVAANSRVGSSTVTTNAVKPTAAPSAPTSLTATLAGTTGLTASWTPPADDGGEAVTGYRVSISPPTGTGVSERILGPEERATTFTDLYPGFNYTVYVNAINGVGGGPSVYASLTMPPREVVTPTPPPSPPVIADPIPSLLPAPVPPPPAPIPPTSVPSQVAKPTVQVKGNKAIVAWRPATSASSPVTKYLVAVTPGKDITTSGSARRAVLKNLKRGTYRITVTAINSTGKSQPSKVVRALIR